MIEENLINWFVKHGNLERKEICIGDNYIEQGYIDSFGFLELISYCEDVFHINFADNDFEKEEIFTISGMIKCIEEKYEQIR